MTEDVAPQRPRGRNDRRRLVGRIGEDVAAEFVTARGWRVLDRNWRNRYGELDLIAAQGRVLVVVEVKTRASRTYTDPVAAVTPQKLSRMQRLIRMWLAENGHGWEQIRFDVISIQLDPRDPEDTAAAAVRHHRGVFA